MLKRGYTQDKSLWRWYGNIVNGDAGPAQRHHRPDERARAAGAALARRERLDQQDRRARASRRAATRSRSSPSSSSTKGLTLEMSEATERPWPTYVTPGVYYERVDASAPAIAPLRTDIAGFVGIARAGSAASADAGRQSWRQFQAWFGDFTGAGIWRMRCAASSSAAAAVPGSCASPRRRLDASFDDHDGDTVAGLADYRQAVLGCGATTSTSVWWRRTARRRDRISTASMPEYSTVDSVAGFVRGSHVRVPTGPAAFLYRLYRFADPDDEAAVLDPSRSARAPCMGTAAQPARSEHLAGD